LFRFHDIFADARGLQGVLNRLGAEVLAIIAHEGLGNVRVSMSMLQDAMSASGSRPVAMLIRKFVST
jgi:hypothetical protein